MLKMKENLQYRNNISNFRANKMKTMRLMRLVQQTLKMLLRIDTSCHICEKKC